MIFSAIDGLAGWTTALALGAHLAAGAIAGIVYFRGLWWTTNRFALGGHALETFGLALARYLLVGSLLTLVSLEGALPLLTTAFGILAARFAVMRRLRMARS